MAGLRSETATSAGGIVIAAGEDGRPSLVIGLRRRDGDRRRGTWTLPKGTPDPGETIEQTALREVEEETGLQVRILQPLPSISYVFVQNGARISKTVHYWLMEPVGGDLSLHDREFERVRWVPFEEAAGVLAFETERSLVDATARTVQAARSESAPGSEQRSTSPSETTAR